MEKNIIVCDPAYTKHDTGFGHPERPSRVTTIVKALEERGLKNSSNTVLPRKATEAEVLLCHSEPYFQLVHKECSELSGTSAIRQLSTGDVVISKNTFEVALLAVGGVLTAVDHVMAYPNTRAFCIVRPPGHHACTSCGMGFCIFNNVAIGARYAQKHYKIPKVLIVDWDVHHGNGTQEIMYGDPTVFYFSTHEQGIYPMTGAGNEHGGGTTSNHPILPGKHSRLEVIKAFEYNLHEQMKWFQPNLVFISAGFDGHEADPLGHFNLTDQDFAFMTQIVCEIAQEYSQSKIVSVLEGGYHLQALATSSVAHCQTLFGANL